MRDTLIVTAVDAGVSLLCGVAVFSVLGNLAHEQGMQVEDVVADGKEEDNTIFETMIPRTWPCLCCVPSCPVTDALPPALVSRLLRTRHLPRH